MSDAVTLDDAVTRLERAMGRLDEAVVRRLEADHAVSALEEELARLGEDRTRLAQDLDGSAARAARLEEVNREVSKRLVGAMETIRGVLDVRGA